MSFRKSSQKLSQDMATNFPESIPRDRAVELCSQSIRRMMHNYLRYHNSKYPPLIRKRLQLRQRLKYCNQTHFSRDELGLVTPSWLLCKIGAVAWLIVKTNRFG